jgi:hypothetical protein
MVLREIGLDGVDRICVAQGRGQWRALVNMLMNLRVQLSERLAGFLRRTMPHRVNSDTRTPMFNTAIKKLAIVDNF